eukprot:CAMPEP_0119313208 /NCGR_PEP_ID=MMETSP1333-20130426/28252_1 /TAXON_ID=418940 /ORGANISM="Scyphosphaera apsteinii, Strain RCC1455" /LENGTH=158 /DNA_ID=CAMNT_0007317991 /DNA_START=63 /DNA_END=539 /DNA_ORIENTATION=+
MTDSEKPEKPEGWTSGKNIAPTNPGGRAGSLPGSYSMNKREFDAIADLGNWRLPPPKVPKEDKRKTPITPVPTESGFCPPAEAGSITKKGLWFYIDLQGNLQGPFETAKMRAWFEAGFFNADTKAAPSFYGERPKKTWKVSELYEHPQKEAFVMDNET